MGGHPWVEGSRPQPQAPLECWLSPGRLAREAAEAAKRLLAGQGAEPLVPGQRPAAWTQLSSLASGVRSQVLSSFADLRCPDPTSFSIFTSGQLVYLRLRKISNKEPAKAPAQIGASRRPAWQALGSFLGPPHFPVRLYQGP